jgi:hypothetical protein
MPTVADHEQTVGSTSHETQRRTTHVQQAQERIRWQGQQVFRQERLPGSRLRRVRAGCRTDAAAERADKRRKLIEALANKQDDAIRNLSEDEIRAKLAELDDAA